MSSWIKIVVPVSTVAVLLTVLAIGVGSSVSYAAKPGTNPGADELACDAGTTARGNLSAGDSDVYAAQFCSDPTDYLVAWVMWKGKAGSDKDLALLVTSPAGEQYYVNHENNSFETFMAGPNLAEGIWTIEVINTGSRSVKYDFSVGFG